MNKYYIVRDIFTGEIDKLSEAECQRISIYGACFEVINVVYEKA